MGIFGLFDKQGKLVSGVGSFDIINAILKYMDVDKRKGVRLKLVSYSIPVKAAALVEECSGCIWKGELDGRHCETCRN